MLVAEEQSEQAEQQADDADPGLPWENHMPVMMKGTMLSSGPSTTYLRVLVNSVAGGTLAITRSRWAMTSAVFAWFSSSCSAPRVSARLETRSRGSWLLMEISLELGVKRKHWAGSRPVGGAGPGRGRCPGRGR